MNGDQYAEMFAAILSLREATELGFDNVRAELQTQLAAQDERWSRRFNALEARVESGFAEVKVGFAEVSASLHSIDDRLHLVEQR